MVSTARGVCVGVVAVVLATCAETGDDLFPKVPDAAPDDPSISIDAGVDAGPPLPEADAAVDADNVDAPTDGFLGGPAAQVVAW